MFIVTAHVFGYMGLALSVLMLLPMGVDLAAGSADWLIFLSAAMGVSVPSGLLVAATRAPFPPFSLRMGFFMVNMLWGATALVAAIPLMLSGVGLSFTDAMFEAVSGITTTGSTILSGLDDLPPGILLWRSLTQWFGGLGIIAMGLLLLPFLKVGGMQAYRMESSIQSDNPYSRFATFSRALVGLYLVLSLLCFLGYMAAGMSVFDAANHAMTTISTGGYSTHDSSMSGYGNAVLLVGIVFMIMGSLPFVALLKVAATGSLAQAREPQIPALLSILFVLSLFVAVSGLERSTLSPMDTAIHAAFNVVSVVSTTGFASADYTRWGPLAQSVLLLATFLGGAAGSTSGGIKTYRLMLLWQGVRRAVSQLIYPHGVFTIRYGDRQVDDQAMQSVAMFLTAFMGILFLTTVALGATGLDLVTAFTGALTAMTNVGPGLGDVIGPVGNFAGLADVAKWILIMAMLMGRLEILTVLVIFSPTFWRA